MTKFKFALFVFPWVLLHVFGNYNVEYPNVDLDFGNTNDTHYSMAFRDISRTDYVKSNMTLKNDSVLLTHGEIVMARDETNGIVEYVAELTSSAFPPHKRRFLEVGFGMAISAELLRSAGCRSHTIVEANADVMRRLIKWRVDRLQPPPASPASPPPPPYCTVHPVFGFWEDALPVLRSDHFHGIMYDPYPSVATPLFLQQARRLLVVGGRLSFFMATYDNSTAGLNATWTNVHRDLLWAGWHKDEVSVTPRVVPGRVMADCGDLYPHCPYRSITYVIPRVAKRRP
jgi:hypothetical protein